MVRILFLFTYARSEVIRVVMTVILELVHILPKLSSGVIVHIHDVRRHHRLALLISIPVQVVTN